MSGGEPALVITLGGETGTFAAFSRPNQWALMQNAEATKNNDAGAALAATYKLAVTSVLHRDRERFEDFMMEHGQDENLEETLTDALLALWNGETRFPLDSTSSDSPESTGENGSTSTADSSGPESSPDKIATIHQMITNGSSIPA